ncbi:hypothetical protein [Sphingobium sp. CAP-1]|uniref:hypothetical protein n=1 Tax=Sphingobium sp. CAP-1 TaxID=2676077 RepID=UPI0012BB2119|nr:hypothetical protein [Sphingobium sp. CAP-1]QGP80021.1 hypothetical protein GL174_14270 [Sphingobium sp. CAP-1]
MADATTARSDNAPRAAELRAKRLETPIVAMAKMLGQAHELYDTADGENSRRAGKFRAFGAVHDHAFSAFIAGQYGLLHLIPAEDGRDLMILAGLASMLASELGNYIDPADENASKLGVGIEAALCTISATIADRWPSGPDTVEPLYPDLARSIRRDVMIVNALRADAEGQ